MTDTATTHPPSAHIAPPEPQFNIWEKFSVVCSCGEKILGETPRELYQAHGWHAVSATQAESGQNES